jgi:hypothetical protein
MLMVAMILVASGGTYVSIFEVYESLPPGRYPILLFATPFVLLAFLGYLAGIYLLRRAGIRVRYDDIILPTGAASPALPTVDPSADDQKQSYANVAPERCSVCQTDVIVDGYGRCPRCGYPV